MDVPHALYIECPSCKEETLHRVIKGSLSEKKEIVLDALVKCSKCGHRHPSIIRTERPVVVPVIVSEQEKSQKNELELPSQENVNIGNEFQLGRGMIKITAIETKFGRVDSAIGKDVTTLWAKKFDRLKLKISINKGGKTLTRTIWAVPDEEFFIGDVMRIKGLNFTIHRIKTQDKIIKKGSVPARNIVRLYGKPIR
ncbi:MAG: hypothetical protein JSW00_18965 [Thermoplasmata archaeon]|nr:MAG: hypothetical protein JSW00_18965 [Thermoplasmata archaeon]